MSKYKPEDFRVKFDIDPDGDLSYLDQWDTPEKYRGNEVLRDGKPIPFEEYIQHEGNPDKHICLDMLVERKCPECGSWEMLDACGSIDFMECDAYAIGEFTLAEVVDWLKRPETHPRHYQATIALGSIPKTVKRKLGVRPTRRRS